jgi:hypothetical protein
VGNAFQLEKIRVDRRELLSLPSYLLQKTLEHFKATSLAALWPTEAELLPELLDAEDPLNDTPPVTSFQVTSKLDVFPNCGEQAPWWLLGNLETDGVDRVIDTFISHSNPGLRLNYETPLKVLARKHGDRNGDRIYGKIDLGQRFIRLEAMD